MPETSEHGKGNILGRLSEKVVSSYKARREQKRKKEEEQYRLAKEKFAIALKPYKKEVHKEGRVLLFGEVLEFGKAQIYRVKEGDKEITEFTIITEDSDRGILLGLDKNIYNFHYYGIPDNEDYIKHYSGDAIKHGKVFETPSIDKGSRSAKPVKSLRGQTEILNYITRFIMRSSIG